MSFVKLLLDDLRGLRKFETVREYTLIPSLFKLRIPLKQLHNNFPLDLHDLCIGYCLDVGTRGFLVYEIMRIDHTTNASHEVEIIELFFDGTGDDKVHIFDLFIFDLYGCTLRE